MLMVSIYGAYIVHVKANVHCATENCETNRYIGIFETSHAFLYVTSLRIDYFPFNFLGK